MKTKITMKDGKHCISREDHTSSQRVASNWLNTNKSLKNKTNKMSGITTYLSILTVNANILNVTIKI
jgi:hypothetical protein